MRTLKTLLLTLALAPFLFNCTSSVRLQVMRPADVTVPPHIQKIMVASRTAPQKKNKVLNVVEGVLSGEGLYTDKEGSKAAVSGVVSVLRETERFDVVDASHLQFKGTGIAAFPEPMAWSKVKTHCAANKVDAMLLLEVFDSDHALEWGTAKRQVKDKSGNTVTVVDQVANTNMAVTTGWRLYDVKNQDIFDVYRFKDVQGFSGSGPTRQAAQNALPPPPEMVNQTGFHAGTEYGWRISPMWIWVSRTYYSKGNSELKRAFKMARVNDFDGAASIWKIQAEKSSDPKIKGRATYNMAIYSEIQGNLNVALEYARKAFTDYNIGLGRTYARQLENRMADEARVDQQMQ